MLGIKLNLRQFLSRVAEEFAAIDEREIKVLADAIHDCYVHGRTVFLCGNGGSGSNASHFCEDLGKGSLRREDFDDDRKKRLRMLSLTDNTPYILAWGNDEGFERVFVEQLKNLAGPGDLLIAISGSGNSPNVLKAVEWANATIYDLRLHRLQRRQVAGTGTARTARAARRHGHGGVDPPDGLSLGRRRHAPENWPEWDSVRAGQALRAAASASAWALAARYSASASSGLICTTLPSRQMASGMPRRLCS